MACMHFIIIDSSSNGVSIVAVIIIMNKSIKSSFFKKDKTKPIPHDF